jgi:hypothetical protein
VQGTLDVFVTDADSGNRQVANELGVTSGPFARVVGSTTFSFRSNGTSAVIIDFKDGASNKAVLINGFALTRSPYHAAARADMGATGQNLESKHTLWSSTETRELMDDILEIRGRIAGLTIVIIEQEMGVIERVTERCVVLNFGKKISEGSYREVAADRQVQEAYLGVE